jgi:sporulation protein YlmC with PRC-barrel domain
MARNYDQPLTSGTPTGVDVERDLRDEWEEEGRRDHRRVIAATKLMGDKVHNTAGEDLGHIEEIMMDVPTGRVAYAVLSFGGFLGMGNKLFAVPWEALTLDQDAKEFVLNIDRKQLEDGPGFDKDNWPDMTDRAWGSQVFAYYGYEPYWERSAPLQPRRENAYMAQSQNRLVCDGCGRQFTNREDLEQHRSECPAVQAQQQGQAGGRTRAMGSGSPLKDLKE